MIPFNTPLYLGTERKSIEKLFKKNIKLSGDGLFTKKCNNWLENNLDVEKALLTTSCTHALEMAAILINIKVGDEVIMPSYTFVSTANAFVLRGAKIVFVDIKSDTMNIDENLIEHAITKKTKAIVLVHYGGVACGINKVLKIAKKYKIYVIEDAAQAIMSKYKNKFLGSIGDIGCFSFHETKNCTMGEGGAILINNKKLISRAEIIREKGTNRSSFLRGEVNKYTWVDIGSSYLPSELNAAYLLPQLKKINSIIKNRMVSWNRYFYGLIDLQSKGCIQLPVIPKECMHNAHIFYMKCKNTSERNRLLEYLKNNNIYSVFHYVPLHTSIAGLKFGRFFGIDKYTTKESKKIVRLPMYYGLKSSDVDFIINVIKKFYEKKTSQ